MDISSSHDEFVAAAHRGLSWLLSRIGPDGGLRGSEGEVTAHYKAVQALATAGFVREAERVMEYAGGRFFADGDFNRGGGDPSAGQFANYRNAWLTWGAHTTGAYELSWPGADFLETAQHLKGGVPARCEAVPETQQVEWGTTAMAVVALLACGRLPAAERAGEHLLEMERRQPEAQSRFFLRLTWSSGWVTEFPQDRAGVHVVEIGSPGQLYWFFGIGIACFSRLYRATAEPRWLAAADRIFELAARCAPGAYEDLTAAKVGWGASALFRVTGLERHARVAVRVGEMLVRTQTPEGVWLRRPQYASLEEQPLSSTYDTASERVLWLLGISRNLSRTEAPRGGDAAG